MITINYITIRPDRTTMDISVTAEVGLLIDSVNLWTDATFKDYSLAIDFTSKLTKASNNETFTITATELGLTEFSGLYFLEFIDTNATPNFVLGMAADLTVYRKCMLDQTLDLLNSSVDLYTGGGCESPEVENIIYLNMILEATKVAIKSSFYGEALDFLEALKKLCASNCTTCPTYTNALIFGVVDNNSIILP